MSHTCLSVYQLTYAALFPVSTAPQAPALVQEQCVTLIHTLLPSETDGPAKQRCDDQSLMTTRPRMPQSIQGLPYSHHRCMDCDSFGSCQHLAGKGVAQLKIAELNRQQRRVGRHPITSRRRRGSSHSTSGRGSAGQAVELLPEQPCQQRVAARTLTASCLKPLAENGRIHKLSLVDGNGSICPGWGHDISE